MTTYRTTVYDKSLQFCADFAQASSPIRVEREDGSWTATQYQVADARHCPENAVRLLIEDCSTGDDEAEILAAIGRLTEEEK